MQTIIHWVAVTLTVMMFAAGPQTAPATEADSAAPSYQLVCSGGSSCGTCC